MNVKSRDEILNGKTLDRNSHFFAQYCFEHGIDLYAPILLRSGILVDESSGRPPENG
jgi:hypothetical protein